MAYCEYFRASCVLSVIAAFDSPLDVSVPTSKEYRHQPPPATHICFGIASGIELGQIHYTVAMETKAQMLIKCVRPCIFFLSRQIGSMKQTACMRATFRAKLPVFCHERSDSDSEYLSSRAPAGVLHIYPYHHCVVEARSSAGAN